MYVPTKVIYLASHFYAGGSFQSEKLCILENILQEIYAKIGVRVTVYSPQNIQPIEITFPPCYKYKVGSLYLSCIKLLYKCIQFHVKENKHSLI